MYGLKIYCTCIYPINFVTGQNPLRFRLRIRHHGYPHPNPHPVIIRSAPNPMKNYGIGYSKGKIRSDPFTPSDR